MLHLLKIDLKKMTSYRTFWVVCGLYFVTLAFTTASGMEFLKWLTGTFEGFGAEVNLSRIPLYHFPDVWTNLVYFSGYLKIVLGIMVVISITNEFTYRTLRQNVIDGLSRWEFLLSKILTNALLSTISVTMVFVIALVTGLIYSPSLDWDHIVTDLEFFPAYFLEVFSFLSYALMLGIVVQRSGLTIILLMLSKLIEFIIEVKVLDGLDIIHQFLPMQSISNFVPMPYARYAFQEIQDYISIPALMIGLAWAGIFNYVAYLKLTRSDI